MRRRLNGDEDRARRRRAVRGEGPTAWAAVLADAERTGDEVGAYVARWHLGVREDSTPKWRTVDGHGLHWCRTDSPLVGQDSGLWLYRGARVIEYVYLTEHRGQPAITLWAGNAPAEVLAMDQNPVWPLFVEKYWRKQRRTTWRGVDDPDATEATTKALDDDLLLLLRCHETVGWPIGREMWTWNDETPAMRDNPPRGDESLQALERALRADPKDQPLASRAAAAFQRTGRVADACLALREAGLPWRELAWANDLQRTTPGIRSASRVARETAFTTASNNNICRYWPADAGVLRAHMHADQALAAWQPHLRALGDALARGGFGGGPARAQIRCARTHEPHCTILLSETGNARGTFPEIEEGLWADFAFSGFVLDHTANPILQAFLQRWWNPARPADPTQASRRWGWRALDDDGLLDLAFALDAHMELGWPIRRAFTDD